MVNKKHKPINKPTKIRIPSVWQLTQKTFFEIKTFWRPLLAILTVYGLSYFVLVMGLGFGEYINSSLEVPKLNNALDTVINQFANGALVGSAQSESSMIIQFLLFLIASMALIWTLRNLQNLQKIKIRDAYYRGTSALLPTMIVALILLFAFIPALVGSAVLAVVSQSASTVLEVSIVSGLAIFLMACSLYLFVMMWPAFYIVSLPQKWPLRAIKSAVLVTKKHRFNLIRKFIALVLILVVLAFLALFPVALVWPAATPVFSYFVIFVLFAVGHTYMYLLYRSML